MLHASQATQTQTPSGRAADAGLAPVAGGEAWIVPFEPGGPAWITATAPSIRVVDRRPATLAGRSLSAAR